MDFYQTVKSRRTVREFAKKSAVEDLEARLHVDGW